MKVRLQLGLQTVLVWEKLKFKYNKGKWGKILERWHGGESGDYLKFV